MNLNKARDFYSAYYEGSLDDGLRQAFERAMASDSEVKAEYAQFVRIMEQLTALQTPVEVPSDLHLKIRDRVDAHIIAVERKSRTASWFFGWKPIAYGAVATVAIIGAVFSLSSRPGSTGVETAGIVPVADAPPRIVAQDGEVRLRFASSKSNSVTLTDVESGRQILSRSVVGQTLDSPLMNGSKQAVVVGIGFARDYAPIYVAVPGTEVSTVENGTGTVVHMVKALASMFSAPVVLETADTAKTIDWVFDSLDPMTAVKDELKTLGLKAEVREGGLLWISSI